ncbi:hypothetical protein PIB30_048815 [Stylosanthes scabra]|uniref:Uncharacterized protein n=1 Tax=Stylosanthes scabra TaxID=79078 RepID=A0ABU6ZFZ0_9FABA|nr:hypothetical protein [Stylosanthes scabra]
MTRHHDETTLGASVTTQEVQNVGNVGLHEFGATVPDIGPRRPKSPKIFISSHLSNKVGPMLYGPIPRSINPRGIRITLTMIPRAPKSLFGEVLLAHILLSYKPPTFRLGTTGYASSPKPLEDAARFISRGACPKSSPPNYLVCLLRWRESPSAIPYQWKPTTTTHRGCRNPKRRDQLVLVIIEIKTQSKPDDAIS